MKITFSLLATLIVYIQSAMTFSQPLSQPNEVECKVEAFLFFSSTMGLDDSVLGSLQRAFYQEWKKDSVNKKTIFSLVRSHFEKLVLVDLRAQEKSKTSTAMSIKPEFDREKWIVAHWLVFLLHEAFENADNFEKASLALDILIAWPKEFAAFSDKGESPKRLAVRENLIREISSELEVAYQNALTNSKMFPRGHSIYRQIENGKWICGKAPSSLKDLVVTWPE